MYDECLSCTKIGVSCDGPNFVAMSAHELLEWCKARKSRLGLSNARLADLSNMPKGTIDRLFAGDHADFKYETIRPLIRALVGGNFDDNPCPAPEDNAWLEEMGRENSRLKEQLEKNEKVIDELKDEHREEARFLRSQVKSKNTALVVLAVLLGITLSVIIGFLAYDYLNRDVGFFWLDDETQIEAQYKEE